MNVLTRRWSQPPRLPRFGAIELPPEAQSALVQLDTTYRDSAYFGQPKTSGTPEASHVPPSLGWGRLPEFLQKMLRPFATPSGVKRVGDQIKSRNLGILEEASDIWYEHLTLTALQEGMLSAGNIEQAVNLVQSQAGAINLENGMPQIKALLDPLQVDRFSRVSGLNKDQALEFLSLATFKFATMRPQGRFLQPVPETVGQLISEKRELEVNLGDNPLRSSLDWCSTRNLSQRAVEWVGTMRQSVLGVVRQVIDPDMTEAQLFQYFLHKHYLRQGLSLQDPKMDPKDRKKITKPFEALVEAQLFDEVS